MAPCVQCLWHDFCQHKPFEFLSFNNSRFDIDRRTNHYNEDANAFIAQTLSNAIPSRNVIYAGNLHFHWFFVCFKAAKNHLASLRKETIILCLCFSSMKVGKRRFVIMIHVWLWLIREFISKDLCDWLIDCTKQKQTKI